MQTRMTNFLLSCIRVNIQVSLYYSINQLEIFLTNRLVSLFLGYEIASLVPM